MAKTQEELLREERVKAGWRTTEWGEFVPPVTEINNKVPTPTSKTKISVNKDVIPAVAEPAKESEPAKTPKEK